MSPKIGKFLVIKIAYSRNMEGEKFYLEEEREGRAEGF
jgi:hypothetical protein